MTATSDYLRTPLRNPATCRCLREEVFHAYRGGPVSRACNESRKVGRSGLRSRARLVPSPPLVGGIRATAASLCQPVLEPARGLGQSSAKALYQPATRGGPPTSLHFASTGRKAGGVLASLDEPRYTSPCQFHTVVAGLSVYNDGHGPGPPTTTAHESPAHEAAPNSQERSSADRHRRRCPPADICICTHRQLFALLSG